MRWLPLVVWLLVANLAYSDDKVLIVGSEQNYPPFALGLTDETADGFTVELWRAVAKESHLQSHLRVLPFHEVLRDFKAGKIDVLINLAQSSERRQFADFTVPHVIVNGAIFARKGDKRIHSEADLHDKSIIVLKADLAHDYAVSQNLEKQLIFVDTIEQGFRLLADGQYDALLLSKLAGQQTVEKLQLQNIEALPIQVGFAQKFSFAVHKGNAELLAQINEGLALTKASGVYDKLYEKWFGVYEEKSFVPLLTKYILSIVSFFMLIIGFNVYRHSLERKQTMLMLQESESRFRDLFENAPLPYQALDKYGRCLYVNEAWLELVGCSQQQAIGQLFSDFVNNASKTLLANLLEQVESDEHGQGNVLLEIVCRHTLEERLVSLKWQVAKDAHRHFQRIHCILIDITERNRAEQELRASEQRFRLLADFAPVFIWLSDADGLYSYVNQVWLDFTGRNFEQELGQGWADNIHPDDYQSCIAIYNKATTAREPFQMTYRLRRHDNVYRWMFDTGIPRFSDNQIFLGYIGSAIDITAHYETEQALKEHQTALAIAHADLLQFTHIAAHHLQEPIRRLVTFVQCLQDELMALPELTNNTKQLLAFIEQSALRQRALLHDMQLYLAATKPSEKVERTSAMNILAKLLKHYAKQIHSANACIDYTVLPPALIDAPRLYDIFDILLDNALRYRHPERRLSIHITGKIEAGRVYYRFADNGIGIPEESRQRVFLVFERLHTYDSESTGIGLAIVHRIVTSCQGKVQLQETLNGGTTVLFDLPA